MHVSKPVSLRNISPEVMRYATQISTRTGLSLSDVFRQALISGCLLELTKLTSDEDGNYGEIEAHVLARTLRRHLASTVDLLLEYRQHPYQGLFQGGQDVRPSTPTLSSSLVNGRQEAGKPLLDQALGDDLELLGMGFGLSETSEG